MNPKSKNYYRMLTDINKENVYAKQSKTKLLLQKQTQVNSRYSNNKNLCVADGPQLNKDLVIYDSQYHGGASINRNNSKKSLGACKQRQSAALIGQRSLKFPKIGKDEIVFTLGTKQRHSKSYKKMITQPNEDNYYVEIKAVSQNRNMKDLLFDIVKKKQKSHFVSIDEQIDKLEALTKRYSCLRKNLVSIQEDILTINLKQKWREIQKQNSHSSSILFP